jgi:hypothetical protein
MSKYWQGKFKPQNPNKYKGDPSNIIYRSSWEMSFMMNLDKSSNVIWWQSEEIVIPYISPIDNKPHRYFPDFLVKTNKGTMLIEIKPSSQTKPPMIVEGKKKTQKYVREVFQWGVNEAKWKYAKEYCKDRGWSFLVITEKELGIAW